MIQYTNCDIPAKLFFDVMHSEDYLKLGGDSKEEAEKAYDVIFDEYFTLMPNNKLKSYLNRRHKINALKGIITCIQDEIYCIINIFDYPSTEFTESIDRINEYIGCYLKQGKHLINVSKGVVDELERVRKQVIGILNNMLNSEIKQIPVEAEKTKYVFTDDLVAIQNVFGYNLPEDISLYKFASLCKAAKEKSDANKKITNGK